MRPCLFLALPLAVFLAACGASHRSTSVAHTQFGLQACGVRVYFAGGASHAEEQALGAKLRRESAVQHVTFVSKAEALAEMKKSNPVIYKTLKPAQNPLPDAFTVVATSPSGVKTIRASVAHAPGVATVKLSACSPTR